MAFSITIQIDTNDTEKQFIDEIISQNSGDAIQVLANGRALDFQNVTDEQKQQYVLAKFGEQFTNIYENTKLEREIDIFRRAKIAERGNRRP